MKLVFIESNRPVTDSLTLAEVFGKQHLHVLRDIEVQIEKLNEAEMKEWGSSNFGYTQYQHHQNKQFYPKYNLTEDAFAIVAMGYVTPEAMKMKVKFLEEFKRMREELTKPQFIMPTNMLETAELWISEMKRNEYLESKNKKLALESAAQQQQLKDQEAPLAIYNLAITAKNTLTMQEVAKAYGTGRTRLYEILREEQLIMKGSTMPYQRFIDAGYFKVVERPRTSGDTVVMDSATRVTAKGFDYIGKLLHKRAELARRMKEISIANAEIAASEILDPILQ